MPPVNGSYETPSSSLAGAPRASISYMSSASCSATNAVSSAGAVWLREGPTSPPGLNYHEPHPLLRCKRPLQPPDANASHSVGNFLSPQSASKRLKSFDKEAPRIRKRKLPSSDNSDSPPSPPAAEQTVRDAASSCTVDFGENIKSYIFSNTKKRIHNRPLGASSPPYL